MSSVLHTHITLLTFDDHVFFQDPWDVIDMCGRLADRRTNRQADSETGMKSGKYDNLPRDYGFFPETRRYKKAGGGDREGEE